MLLVTTLLLLVALGVTSAHVDSLGWFSDIFNTVLFPLQKLLTAAGNGIEETVSFFAETGTLRKENERLRSEVEELKKEIQELNKYRKENDDLKKALNLKDEFKDFEYVGANIIAKDMGNWFNVFTIDAGTADGVEKYNPVITGSGFVGKVISAGRYTSKVISIIDVDSAISARLSKSGYVFTVKGDLSFQGEGLCRMDITDASTDIAVGDEVETSGLNDLFPVPKGILIGSVKEIRRTRDGLGRYAIIQPAVNFRNLDKVIVLKYKSKTQEIME